MKLLYDVETNGLLNKLTRIHIIAIRDVTNYDPTKRPTYIFRRNDEEDTIAEGVRMLEDAEIRCGHNIIGFDEKAILKVFPNFKADKAKLLDTLVLSRVIAPDLKKADSGRVQQGKFPSYLVGSHSLDAWGFRLGKHKGDYSKEMTAKGIDPWAAWNQPMEDYCVNDIDVNEILLAAIEKDMPPETCIDLETSIHSLSEDMRDNGVPFDLAAARTLRSVLLEKHDELCASAVARYGYWYAPDKKYIVKDPWEIRDEFGNIVQKKKKRAKGNLLPKPDKKYETPRPEFGEDDSRAIWAEVTVPTRTRRAAEKIAKWEADNAKRAAKGKPLVERPNILLPDITEGAPYCKIKRLEFNPGSRHHIIDRFTTVHEWVPTEFTETGMPRVDDDVLTALAQHIEYAKPLANIFFHKKLLGQLGGSEDLAKEKSSWIKNFNHETGCIHGYINVGGTVSGRCSHSSPNLGQVPAVMMEDVLEKDGSFNAKFVNADGFVVPWALKEDGTPKKKAVVYGREGDYGWECRSLFGVPEDWGVQVGVDLKNIEARCLAAVLAEFDKGELVSELISGTDLHEFNMSKTGITNKGIIKRVFFGLIYGAGDPKLGYTAEPGLTEDQARKLGGEYRALIMESIPALAKADEKVKKEAKRGYLIGLDGRILRVRNEYAALNLRLQSNAGLIAKKWAVLSHRYCQQERWAHGWLGQYAMMLFVHDELGTAAKHAIAQRLAELQIKAAADAGEFFNFPCPVAANAQIGGTWAETH